MNFILNLSVLVHRGSRAEINDELRDNYNNYFGVQSNLTLAVTISYFTLMKQNKKQYPNKTASNLLMKMFRHTVNS